MLITIAVAKLSERPSHIYHAEHLQVISMECLDKFPGVTDTTINLTEYPHELTEDSLHMQHIEQLAVYTYVLQELCQCNC